MKQRDDSYKQCLTRIHTVYIVIISRSEFPRACRIMPTAQDYSQHAYIKPPQVNVSPKNACFRQFCGQFSHLG
jgi:hypothetical protein